MSTVRLIVAGGGTGGHVWAGVAIADAWQKRFAEHSRVVFVGARGGIEEKLVPRAGYRLELLRLGSLKRVSHAKRVKTGLQLPLAIARSLWILLRERPHAVIGVGGYASGPLVMTARCVGWLWGTNVAILEQNAVPGFTNRVLSRFAHLVMTAFAGIEKGFPGVPVKVTGNPTRASMLPLAPATRDPFTVFIFGGSQGAMGINTLVLEALPHLSDLLGRLRFIHQTGEKDYQRVVVGHSAAGTQARVEKFIFEMPQAYAEASLLITRAGASTLSELAAVRRAAVLIPLPTAADNHQEKNAMIFVEGHAACMLKQGGATGADLAALIRERVEHPDLIAQMETAVACFDHPLAAERIVELLKPL